MLLLHSVAVGYVPAFSIGRARARVAMNMQTASLVEDATTLSLLEEPADELQRAGARFARKASYAPKERSWPEFTYSPPDQRREMVRNHIAIQMELPPLRIMLLGGPATGKGRSPQCLSRRSAVAPSGLVNCSVHKREPGLPSEGCTPRPPLAASHSMTQ